MAMANFTFQTVAHTVVILKMVQPKVKAVLCTQMETFMSDNGKMIKHMDMELIIQPMEDNIKASGNLI